MSTLAQSPAASDASGASTTSADPNLPALVPIGGEGRGPAAPRSLDATGVDPQVMIDLALKLASTVPQLNSDWAARQLRLPAALVERIFWQLKEDHLVEILGQTDQYGGYRYATTQRGREYAHRSLEISGYIGPAPVCLAHYTAMLDAQASARPRPTLDQVRQALADLVVTDHAINVAALAASSARSLFLFGPPGNGKTSMGRLLHRVITGELWIPHCLSIDHHIIRIFDRHCHQVVNEAHSHSPLLDQRWIRIRPPFVVAGGEMTIDQLDLAYSPALRFYEAPPHVKANGGTFLIDDLGRQRVDPHELLNRWIIPLEHGVDHLTLTTGQKIQVPFRLMLIVATNLNVATVADPAFLRRMGYRLELDRPDEDRYARIFQQYAASVGLSLPPDTIQRVLNRYKVEKRELRASEPRDLIERMRDICLLHRRPFAIDDATLDLAWTGFFGNT